MAELAVSRRNLLGIGACVLVGGAGLPPAAQARSCADFPVTSEAIIRRYYGGWEKKDWGLVDAVLADNFTFTSAAPDDHLSKSRFKKQCWETQNALIAGFDLELLFGDGDQALVKYLCRTTSGKSFRNVEYLRLRDGKVEAIECYFGGPGYPSAANTGHS
jgi:ketosteroid isomerase-like protein